MAKRKTNMKSGLADSKSPRTKVVVKKIYNRGRYKVVDGTSTSMIEQSSPETVKEDEILSPDKRGKLLSLTRNLVRNSSLFNTILGQLTTNVVSTCGGKVVLSLPNEDANRSIMTSFKKWTRCADFFTCDNFNRLLKRVLREYVIGGDVVLVYDDGVVEDSGKVMMFESNEIVNVAPTEIEKRYGKGAWISQGKVYSRNGRNIGVVVSKSQRDVQGEADPTKCWFLKRDPNANPLESNWCLFSSNWREGRGVSQAASAIATIHQLEDLVQSELMASRRNSQIFCWLTQNMDKSDEQMPSAFDSGTDFSSMTDEEIDEAVKQEVGDDVQTISFNKAQENSIVYEALPDGFDAKQLQTQHPNTNIQVMVDFLANRCAASLGLSKVFADGNPEDSNWRSNQLFTWPAINEFQHELEQVADWCFNCFVKWASNKGEIKSYITSDFQDYVDWEWRQIDDLSPVEHENGIRLALQNHTKTYKEVLGNGWKQKLEQVAYEHKWMIEHGITPIDDLMISGGQTEASKVDASTNELQ